MFGKLMDHDIREKQIESYRALRVLFGSLVKTIEKCLVDFKGYHGVVLTEKDEISFGLAFFDRVKVTADFTPVLKGDDSQPKGRISFKQEGRPCRTYYFNEHGAVFDASGDIMKRQLLDPAQIADLLTEVAHQLISDGVAFEKID